MLRRAAYSPTLSLLAQSTVNWSTQLQCGAALVAQFEPQFTIDSPRRRCERIAVHLWIIRSEDLGRQHVVAIVPGFARVRSLADSAGSGIGRRVAERGPLFVLYAVTQLTQLMSA